MRFICGRLELSSGCHVHTARIFPTKLPSLPLTALGGTLYSLQHINSTEGEAARDRETAETPASKGLCQDSHSWPAHTCGLLSMTLTFVVACAHMWRYTQTALTKDTRGITVGLSLPVPTLRDLTAMQMDPIALRISHPIFSPPG